MPAFWERCVCLCMQTLHFAYAVQNPDLSACAGLKAIMVIGMRKLPAETSRSWRFRLSASLSQIRSTDRSCCIVLQLYRGTGHVGRALRLSSRQLSPAEHDCAGDSAGRCWKLFPGVCRKSS